MLAPKLAGVLVAMGTVLADPWPFELPWRLYEIEIPAQAQGHNCGPDCPCWAKKEER